MTWGDLILRVQHLIRTLGEGAAPMVAAEVADWVRADEKRRREAPRLVGR